MKTKNYMFRTIYNCLKRIGAVALAVAAAGCSVSELDDAEIPESLDEGYVAIGVSIPGVTRAETETDGEWTENAVRTLDFFFYDTTAGEDAAAVYTKGIAVNDATLVKDKTNTVKVPFDFKNCTAGSYRVIAVANWFDKDDSNPDMPEKPTIGELKAMITKADAKNNEGDDDRHAFRAADAPSDFVMTNLTQADETVKINATQKTGSGKVNLKRIAAKIRVALDVVETVTDSDGKAWKPDLKDMRLFINNGVRKARLDGGKTDLTYDAKDLAASDYYDILTQGSRETEDYGFARKLSLHQPHTEDSYKYYNDLPLYTYPCEWDESVSENHPTTLTIVVPWEKTENEKKTYRPTYYTIHVNNDYKIESNKYYYLRLHIGMMGSVTPEQPMEVEMECVIDEWGHAQNTDVDIRPIRYLIFNQTNFVMNNETGIEIPFISTHDCEIVSLTGWYYVFSTDRASGNTNGDEIKRIFDDKTAGAKAETISEMDNNGKFFFRDIDNNNNKLIFRHNFFNAWTVNTRNVDSNGRISTMSSGGNKLYSRLEVEIKVQHKQDASYNYEAYSETIHLIIYPSIYVSSEHIIDDSGRSGSHGSGWPDGYVLVNGYGTDGGAQSGDLGPVYGDASGESRSLTTITITQFDEDEKDDYIIGDPRTYYINDELSDDSMKSDVQDNYNTWTYGSNNKPGPFDGSSENNFNAAQYGDGICLTIWSYYGGDDWSNGTDVNKRGLKYYYPTSKLVDEKTIAPQLIISSHHGTGRELYAPARGRRRCATYQQYGYPAGRWRVPTYAEFKFFRTLQNKGIINDVFGANPVMFATGNADTDMVPNRNPDATARVRCVYDLWYWRKVDGTDDRIPYDGTVPDEGPTKANRKNFTYFTWGDRPKQNPQETEVTDDADEPSVQSFLRQHGKGNYAVIEQANGRKKLEKLENLPMIEKPQMSN